MIIGTRGSALALAQTNTVKALLAKVAPGMKIDVLEVRTTGDSVTDRPLNALGGFGAFVKELDQKIVAGEIDVAVNSLKDMPVDLTPGTELAAVLSRAPVEDVLLSKVPLDELPKGAKVGSSSVRRRALLLNRRPDLSVVDLRGNVGTRIRKWKEGEYDAIVLARAGMLRLGLEEQGFSLNPEEFVPAVGQGAIAIVCAEGSGHLDVLRKLEDPKTRAEVDAERYILRALGGGCSVPLGILARKEGDCMHVRGTVVSDNPLDALRVDEVIPLRDLKPGLDGIVDALRRGWEGDFVVR